MAGELQLTNSKRHARAREFFRLMAKHGIKVVEVQVKVVDHELNIRTEIDAVGQDSSGRKVAIELKTTQHDMATFSRSYYTQCRNKPTLTNKLPNCLYWRHQLQIGFGVLASDCTRGVVAVMCTDGGILYELNPAVLHRTLFVGAASLTDKAYAPTQPYPHHADEELLAALKRKLKYAHVVRHEPTIVRGPHGDAVLVIVHKPANYQKSRAAKGHRELARQLAAKHSVACVIAWLDKGLWRFQTAVKRKTV